MKANSKLTATVTTGVLGLLTLTMGVPLIAMAGLNTSGEPIEWASRFAPDGIPPVPADAYQRAADAAAGFSPLCEIPAWILAGVGEVESGHGTHGGAAISADGDVTPRIIGIPLPALGGDTDAGVWDGSTTVDHAVGPMQFIPATWRTYGRDGNDDGIIDPHNIYDAALAAAAYLCAAGSPMATEADWRRGLLAYNHSHQYVDDVLAAAASYRTDIVTTSVQGGEIRLVHVDGIGPTNESWAPQVRAMLAAAQADGVVLTGHSYRDSSAQIALRRAHCGTSTYAIYEMSANRCRPPTARPGASLHEQGLAIDFNNCSSRTTRCYRWLIVNSDRFEVRNLPSEPWHWSLDGT